MKHFIYCRKSSEDDDRQALSIVAQLSELDAIARANNLQIVETLTESKSARNPGREVFNDMLRRIEAGEAKGILTWKLDRLARNFDDGGRIIGMLQRGVIEEIRTFEKTYLPSDNVLTIAVEFGMANQYVRDLSVNIRRGIREKVRRGVFHGKAPYGYFNEPRLRTIEPHPERFPKLKKILEMFATGDYSMTGIQRAMSYVGLLDTRDKNELALSSITKILRRPFYYGVFEHRGELHPGTHTPMISKKTFDEIQAVLQRIHQPRNGFRKQKGLLFLNFARCGSCGMSITGERHIKKSGLQYYYYRCSHKSQSMICPERNATRQADFENEVRRNVEMLSLSDEWKEKFLARVENWSDEGLNKKHEKVERLKAEFSTLKSKIERINAAFTDGTLNIDEFKEIKNPLVPKRLEIEQKIIELETSRSDRLEPLRNWISEANQVRNSVSENNLLKMKSFLIKVGSNRLLRAKTLRISLIKPWNFLAETNLAARTAGTISERTSLMWSLLDKARTHFDDEVS